MEPPDLDVCKVLAIKHGLPLQFIIKDAYLMEALSQIAAHQEEICAPVFKGGTALNKIHLGGMQRFSEDLDFDVEGDAKSACMKAAAALSGFRIGEIRKVGKTWQFDCGFESLLGKDNVRVDIARKPLIASEGFANASVSSPFSQKSVAGVRAYSLNDLVARKLFALESRAEGKDLYDAHSALPLCKGMGNAIGKMLESEAKGSSVDEFLKHAVEKVRRTDPKKAGNLCNPFIPSKNRPKSWQILKNELATMLFAIE